MMLERGHRWSAWSVLLAIQPGDDKPLDAARCLALVRIGVEPSAHRSKLLAHIDGWECLAPFRNVAFENVKFFPGNQRQTARDRSGFFRLRARGVSLYIFWLLASGIGILQALLGRCVSSFLPLFFLVFLLLCAPLLRSRDTRFLCAICAFTELFFATVIHQTVIGFNQFSHVDKG